MKVKETAKDKQYTATNLSTISISMNMNINAKAWFMSMLNLLHLHRNAFSLIENESGVYWVTKRNSEQSVREIGKP